MPNKHPLVTASNIFVSLGGQKIFSELSFKVFPGEHMALLGANGTGKSTLLRLVSGTMRLPQRVTPVDKASSPPANGSICWAFDGIDDASALNALKHIRLLSPDQQSEYVRQGWKINGLEIVLSGYDNTKLLYDIATEKQNREVLELASSCKLDYLLPMQLNSMSQGQLRAVLLMRAMSASPRLLLLDEPFDGLDQATRSSMLELMECAINKGSTLIVTAHRSEDIPAFIKKRCSIAHKDGKTILAKQNQASLTQEYNNQNMAQSPCSSLQTDTLDDSFFMELLLRQRKRVELSLPDNAPVLQLKAVNVYVERKQVIFNLDWTVNKGEQWIIEGPNGSGKSSLLRLLYGDEFAALGGSLKWFGREHITYPDLHELTGFVSDRLHYVQTYDLSAEEVVLGGFKGQIGLHEEPSEEERRFTSLWLERLGLSELKKRSYNSLSTGQAKKILLARSLAGAPPVLLLDEPFSGLDPQSREKFMQLLKLLASSGVQLFFVSHNQDDYSDLFTHKLSLSSGKAVYTGPIK